MKYTLSLALLLLFSNCKTQEIFYFDEQPDKYDLSIIDETIGSELNLITFTANFDNDKVDIFIDNDSIYNGSISTDHTLGAAKVVKLNRYCKSILVVLNNKKIWVKNSSDYRFVYFSKKNEKYSIEYRKKPLKFG